MKSAVCTLFEGDYHYGLGALVNSLYFHRFRGVVWVGYRGELPPWANSMLEKEGYREHQVSDGLYIRFISLKTNYHLTNYKPIFLLDLWKNYCPDIDSLFYFDPDIVIKCRWSFFEEWVTYGIALCEDVISPILSTHPLRMAWKKFYEPYGFHFNYSTDSYVNGGFLGIVRDRIDFLELWLKIQELMVTEIGNLSYANAGKITDKKRDRSFLFHKTDQDALNIALMNSRQTLSLIGKEGMDINYGGFTMSHAIGSPKPWQKQISLMALKGKPPRLADKEYWKNTQYPIKLYSSHAFFAKKLDLMIGKILGRIL